ncbi:MAG TPA: tetratricopeptide repeat protein [Candidatus Saccharimonadales bacterium]|nr:tetratricopeptide repeat protein [Candidatus Saccharimonadales bacterium]
MADPTLATAAQLIDQGRPDEALLELEPYVAEHPDDPEALYLLGSAHDSAGHEAEAVDPYRRALALGVEPERAVATRIQLASTLRNLGRSGEAVELLREVVEARPDHRAARMFLSLALLSDDRPADAVHVLLDLLLTDPGPPEAYRRSLRWYADDLVGLADHDD